VHNGLILPCITSVSDLTSGHPITALQNGITTKRTDIQLTVVVPHQADQCLQSRKRFSSFKTLESTVVSMFTNIYDYLGPCGSRDSIVKQCFAKFQALYISS